MIQILQEEIKEINTALSHIRKGGQSYTINSGAAGTSRTVTMADYNSLIKHKEKLQRQLDSITGRRAISKRVGW